MRPPRQGGALLLMVALLLATLAALAFGMNRAGSVELRSINDDYEGRAATYLAEAGVAAARWSSQVNDCKDAGYQDEAFGAGTFTVAAKQNSGKLKITASGRFNGVVRTLEKPEFRIFNFSKPERVDIDDDVKDTTIAQGSPTRQDKENLRLVSGQSHILMSWDLDDIDDDMRVISATLTLVQAGAGGAPRRVAVHRVTTGWDDGATWTRPRPGVVWDGGTYNGAVLAIASVPAAGLASWNVTGLLDSWAGKRVSGQGLLLRLLDPDQAATFYSNEATDSRRPLLRVVAAKKC
jgi:hypothetical protein